MASRKGCASGPAHGVHWRHNDAGWSSSVARWAHNPEVAGSNPVPATEGSGPGIHWIPGPECFRGGATRCSRGGALDGSVVAPGAHSRWAFGALARSSSSGSTTTSAPPARSTPVPSAPATNVSGSPPGGDHPAHPGPQDQLRARRRARRAAGARLQAAVHGGAGQPRIGRVGLGEGRLLRVHHGVGSLARMAAGQLRTVGGDHHRADAERRPRRRAQRGQLTGGAQPVAVGGDGQRAGAGGPWARTA